MTKIQQSITVCPHPKNSAKLSLQSNQSFSLFASAHHLFIFKILTIFCRYPAQVIRVNTSGNVFDRQSMVRKSLLHVQNGLHALQAVESDINTDSVQRRSRSRKPHGNRRNTIVGIGQKEIKTISENRFVNFHDFHRALAPNLISLLNLIFISGLSNYKTHSRLPHPIPLLTHSL